MFHSAYNPGWPYKGAVMSRSSLFAVAFAGLFAMSLAACGLDEYYTSIGDKAVAGQPLFKGGQSGEQVVECTCNCEGGGSTTTFAGAGFVMDQLKLGAPLVTFKDVVNDFIAGEMTKGTINVLMSVLDDDRLTGIMRIRFGVGTKAGSTYAFSDGFADVEAALTAESGAFTFVEGVEKFILTVPMDQGDPISIPIQNVILTGTISGGKITGGTLTGVVSRADADATVVAGFQLSSVLLDAEQVQPDYDMDQDGTMDAWVFNGTFTAKSATVTVELEPAE